MNVAVLGAGNGGHAAAADLTMRGFDVNLYESPEFEENIKPIVKNGGVYFSGAAGEGFARLRKVTTNIKEAIEDAEIVMVVTPAFAHEDLAKKCAPHLRGQLVVVNPGHTGGALAFARHLKETRYAGDLKIGETMVLTYICRMTSPGQVKIFHVMKRLLFSAFPSRLKEEIYRDFKELYPAVVLGENVLDTSLTNLAAVMHPPGMLLNAGWIEFTKGAFKFYYEGITHSVARVAEALDSERLKIMQTLGLKPIPFTEWYYLQGCTPVRAKSVYEALQAGGPDQYLKAPGTLDHRYVSEEVNFGLVPMASLGRMFGVPTPNIDALIGIASTIRDIDFWKEGLTAQKMGIGELSLERLNRFLKDGYH